MPGKEAMTNETQKNLRQFKIEIDRDANRLDLALATKGWDAHMRCVRSTDLLDVLLFIALHDYEVGTPVVEYNDGIPRVTAAVISYGDCEVLTYEGRTGRVDVDRPQSLADWKGLI